MSSLIPDIQCAWTAVRRGTPAHALVFREDWPVPKKLESGEVLVRVQAAALNPVGWKVMRLLPNFLAKRPHVVEHDLSGIVVDANGTNFSDGDNVYGWVFVDIQQKTRQGALAQYIKVPADRLILRPANITPVESAGITLAALTAYQALFKVAKLDAEQILFVNGGSTAVGAFAIQLAKSKGARVVATASKKNEEFVYRMGADEFIDYTSGPLVSYLTNNPPSTKYNVIFDAVGLNDPSLFTHSAKYLAPGGVFVTSGPNLPHNLSDTRKMFKTLGAIIIPSWLGNVNRRWALVAVKNDTEDAKEINRLLANGSVKPVVDSVYDFKDALQAYDRILTSRAVGKVVVKVDAEAT